MLMSEVEVQLIVNGVQRKVKTAPHRTLLKVLRQDLDLTGTKDGCSQGDCGACVVLMDGKPVNSCLVLAPQADGKEIITVEGLASEGQLHELQQAFAEKWGLQCGFCTPGMLISSYALLMAKPEPTREEVQKAIAGNLCRCTGYAPIIDSVQHAAALLQEVNDAQ
jgi:aerobic carbon-monoxide dehydrogenase small subunit